MRTLINLGFFLAFLGSTPSYSIVEDLECPSLNTTVLQHAIENQGTVTLEGRWWTFIGLPGTGHPTFVSIHKTSKVSKCPIVGEAKIYYCTYSAHIRKDKSTLIVKNKPLCVDDY